MNDLFYLGIIIPTVITIVLFLIFIYCWFLQKARKEVLTKKYDPHGKMRRLGMSMDPPPPPRFCQAGQCLLPETGEDNCAYDVSRSPSTEQEGQGQPMYHTYHDSGISNCLSPSHDHEPIGDFAYRACPDSGFSLSLNPGTYGHQQSDQRLISPLSPCEHHPLFYYDQHQHSSASQMAPGRGGFSPEPMRPHQILTDQIQVHAGEQGFFQHPMPLADLRPKVQPASVHPSHGVCYGDDTRHPQCSQHYEPPQLCHGSLVHHNQQAEQQHAHRPPQSLFRDSSVSQINIIKNCSNQTVSYNISPTNPMPNGASSLDFNYPMKSQRLLMNIPVTTLSKNCHSDPCVQQCLHLPLATSIAYHSHASSLTSPLGMSHSYNKSGLDTSHAQNSERPDSQASQSSTTDSEDSGFRSSHHKSNLGKQGNPLMKPTRRIKNKNKIQQPGAASPMTPMVTLSPHQLQINHDVIQTSSIMGVDLAHRSPGVLKQNTSSGNLERDTGCFPQGFQKGLSYRNSPSSEEKNSLAQKIENWPPQSTNDRETVVKQNIDLSDISTHLSWKYQQDAGQSGGIPPLSPNQNNRLQQSCHQGMGSGQMMKMTADQHMELVGYSVV
ncbi:myb-like protein I [Biomphalaria pfeifferi]|uniref:Myb-like protein I n=1 Tax=Biomphalaria pfeifferi TaxID=112525 RepID=A0AAD8B888_BIOPF|nr:myb-like protein I [Biomphalaria pfeifferi]